METIESIPVEQFRKGFKGISKELNQMNATVIPESSRELIEWFYELMDEHFSTSDILPFE